MRPVPVLYLVVPCFNEEQVLPVTIPLFLEKLRKLTDDGRIDPGSRLFLVDDGSTDNTWKTISDFAERDEAVSAIGLARNSGHQNALLAGMLEAKDKTDIIVTMDCDGQDDINAVDEMIEEYRNGSDVVYGVRSNRDRDTGFKRFSAHAYYRLLRWMGVRAIYDHADYRLVSRPVLEALSQYQEVNLFLRGIFPLIGFRSSCVAYCRKEREAGKSKYPLSKMLALAMDGITSFSVKPIRCITVLGLLTLLFSFALIVYTLVQWHLGNTVQGWSSTFLVIITLCSVQLISLGVIGEYIGKIYLETKRRPRYIVCTKIGSDIKNE